MEEINEFLEDNKTAVLQEMAFSINNMNELMIGIIDTEDSEKGEIAKNKILFQLFHALGALTSLYNQLSYLETGLIPKEQEQRPIGFRGLIEDQIDKKNKKEK